MSAIEITIADKTFNSAEHRHCAIADLQLKITQHQFVCLVGPSGCGKTTLLNIIAGLDTDYQGSISLNNHPAAAHIGYIFQNPRLLPWLTVRENIEIVFDAQPPTELIDDLLKAMQLETVQQVYPERLSLGMQRRVAIIRAFAINPELLLMDEPFVSLDAPNARQIRLALQNLWQQRPHTVLFVTHDLREAIALADRLIFLSPAPMQVIADIPVTIQPELRQDDLQIEQFRQHLLQHFPAIDSLL